MNDCNHHVFECARLGSIMILFDSKVSKSRTNLIGQCKVPCHIAAIGIAQTHFLSSTSPTYYANTLKSTPTQNKHLITIYKNLYKNRHPTKKAPISAQTEVHLLSRLLNKAANFFHSLDYKQAIDTG